MASKDPFEIGKVDGVGGVGGSGGVGPTSYIPGGGAAGRIGGSTPAGSTGGTGTTDNVSISNEANEDNTVKDQNMASLLSALKAPEPVASTQKVNEVSSAAPVTAAGGNNYDPGMQAGAVYGGSGGVQGVQPGMQAGAVHSTRPTAE